MELIHWDDSLSVGVQEIDDQHKKLIGFINQLAEFIKKDDALGNPLEGVLSGLFNYTVYHFFTEEQIMEANDYDGYAVHKSEHIDLTSGVIDYLDRFIRGEREIHQEVFEFLKKWLMDHIQNTDKKLGVYITDLRKQPH